MISLFTRKITALFLLNVHETFPLQASSFSLLPTRVVMMFSHVVCAANLPASALNSENSSTKCHLPLLVAASRLYQTRDVRKSGSFVLREYQPLHTRPRQPMTGKSGSESVITSPYSAYCAYY